MAGTTLSTLEYFFIQSSPELQNPHITNEGTEGYRRQITGTGNKASKWEVGLTTSMA